MKSLFSPRKILFACFALLSCPGVSQDQDIQKIRKIYYQKLSFDTIVVSAEKMVPGLGEQSSKTSYIYYNCKEVDCEDSITSDQPTLRKVIFDQSVNTSVTHTEFLYNQTGELIFLYKKVSSEDYFYETGRECAEERFYLKSKALIFVKISPCREYDSFDEVELIKNYPDDIFNQLNSKLIQSKTYSEIFTLLLSTED